MNTSIARDPSKERLSAGLDFYKATMSQVAYETHPDAQVTFELKNRRSEQKIADYVSPEALQQRLDQLRSGWKPDELAFLAGQLRIGNEQSLFSQDFLDYLLSSELPPVSVLTDEETGDLRVRTTGDWPSATFWETVVMSEVNEMYFENYIRANGLVINEIYAEGERRLDRKIQILKDHPGIKFADFGTRRRFSYRWHKHVLERLIQECPGNLVGTSNIWLAKEFNLMLIGTYAHEMPMVYAALADLEGRDPMLGHAEMMLDWKMIYGHNLSTGLTDTFTSDFFFADFTKEDAEHWHGLRHDSGDPFEFGERVIKMYEDYGINPHTKTIVFSDGLDIDKIVELHERFGDRINIVFGWGTTLTNDLGLPALNIVMKAIMVDGRETVKNSDDRGKELGSLEVLARYEEAEQRHIAARALKDLVTV